MGVRKFTQTTQQVGYNYADALLAIKLIARDRSVTHKDLAKVCSISDKTISSYMEMKPAKNLSGNYGTEFLGMPAHIVTKSHSRFKPSDLEKMATYLGKKYKEYEEKGFITVGAMIDYAQKNCTLPEGEKWFKTDHRSQEAELKFREQVNLLPQYKRAALLLTPLTKKSLTTLTQNITAGSSLVSYLHDNKKAHLSTDEFKLEKFELLAARIGKELDIPEMTLEGMLAEAKSRFPAEFPDKETGAVGGSRSHR